MIDNNTGNNIAFDAIKIGMASPEQILIASNAMLLPVLLSLIVRFPPS